MPGECSAGEVNVSQGMLQSHMSHSGKYVSQFSWLNCCKDIAVVFVKGFPAQGHVAGEKEVVRQLYG